MALKGWYGNKHKHSLASRGIKTKIDIGESFWVNEGEDHPISFPDRLGFDFKQTVVHGTSYENAKLIKDNKWLKEGTFTHGGRGGFEDASIWAYNSYRGNPVVIMAEVEDDISERDGLFGSSWITLGDRGRRGERSQDVIMDKLKIKKMKVFRVPDNVSYNRGVLIEIEELEIK